MTEPARTLCLSDFDDATLSDVFHAFSRAASASPLKSEAEIMSRAADAVWNEISTRSDDAGDGALLAAIVEMGPEAVLAPGGH